MTRTPGTPPRAPTPRELPSAGAAAGAHSRAGACRTRRGRPHPALHRRSTYLGDHRMTALLVRTRGPSRPWRTSGPSPGPTIPVEIRDATSDRARRLLGAEIRYIDHPSFDDPDARDAILAPMPAPDLAQAPRRAEVSAGLPPYLASLYHEVLLLSRDQEAHLLRTMNY